MEKESSYAFGELLKSFRKSHRVSQITLAQRIGTTRQTVGNWERGEYLPKSKAMLLEIANILKLSDSETRQLLETSITSVTFHWLVPYPQNLLFTGREETLATLHRLLSSEKTVVLTQSLAVYGIGGIGKTQLALEYAYRRKLEYSAIFWINAEAPEQITSSFVAIARYLQLPEHQDEDQQKVITAVHRWLNSKRGWLLIWDNLDKLESLSQLTSPLPLGSHLITTCGQAVGASIQGLELLTLPPEQGLIFLLRRAKLLDTSTTRKQLTHLVHQQPKEYEAAKELVSQMDGLPLALDQAGAYIEETHCGVAGYLERYQHQRGLLLARRGSSFGTGHPASVMTTFTLACERLALSQTTAGELLKVCAFLAADGIPEELFTSSTSESALQALQGNPIELDLALAAMLQLSLVQRQPEMGTFSLHRLVKAVQEDLLGEEQQHWAEMTVRLVAAAFPDSKNFANWQQCQRLLPHVMECAKHIRRWKLTLLEGAWLLNEAGAYLRQRAQFSQALSLLKQALEIREQVLGAENLEVAESINDLGGFHWAQGNHYESFALYQRALVIRERLLGPDDLLVAKSLNNLAMVYARFGNHLKAAPLLQRALTIFEQTLGASHPAVATCLGNLGEALEKLDQPEECLAAHLRALEIRKHAFGIEHPDVAHSLKAVGDCRRALGQFAEAEALHQQALVIREKTLGLEHPDVAFSLDALAQTQTAQGQFEQASILYERALTILEQSLGVAHFETSFTVANLARLRWHQGKRSEAHELFQRALAIQDKQLGDSHPETVRTRTSYAQLVRGGRPK